MGRGAAGDAIFAALHRRVAARAACEHFGRRFWQSCAAKRQSFLALAVKKYENAESQRHWNFKRRRLVRVRGHAEFVRRETTHSTDDADERARQASRSLPGLAPASSDSFEAQWAISETPTKTARQPQPMRAREQSKAAPRARGAPVTSIPHGRLARTTATQPPAQLNEAALTRGSRPCPDEEGLPALPRLHYLATYSAGAAKQALPRAGSKPGPSATGSRREARQP